MNKTEPQTTSYTIWFYCTNQRAKQTPACYTVTLWAVCYTQY